MGTCSFIKIMVVVTTATVVINDPNNSKWLPVSTGRVFTDKLTGPSRHAPLVNVSVLILDG